MPRRCPGNANPRLTRRFAVRGGSLGTGAALVFGGPPRLPILLDRPFGHVFVLGANHTEHRRGRVVTARHRTELFRPASNGGSPEKCGEFRRSATALGKR